MNATRAWTIRQHGYLLAPEKMEGERLRAIAVQQERLMAEMDALDAEVRQMGD